MDSRVVKITRIHTQTYTHKIIVATIISRFALSDIFLCCCNIGNAKLTPRMRPGQQHKRKTPVCCCYITSWFFSSIDRGNYTHLAASEDRSIYCIYIFKCTSKYIMLQIMLVCMRSGPARKTLTNRFHHILLSRRVARVHVVTYRVHIIHIYHQICTRMC